MSSSTQRGLKRVRRSLVLRVEKIRNRKEEDKVLAGSMKSYLFGETTREPRAGDQGTTVSEVREYEGQDSSEKEEDEMEPNREKESLDGALNRDLLGFDFSFQEQDSDDQTGFEKETEGEEKQEEEEEKKQREEGEEKQEEGEKKQEEEEECEGKERFTEHEERGGGF